MYCPHNVVGFCAQCAEHAEQEEIDRLAVTITGRFRVKRNPPLQGLPSPIDRNEEDNATKYC